MKRYFFGLVALAIAVGLSSYTVIEKRFASTVYYQLSTFTSAQVTNDANWTTSSKTCVSGTSKACQFDVPAAQITSGGVLQNTTITAGQSGSTFFVSDATNADNIINKN